MTCGINFIILKKLLILRNLIPLIYLSFLVLYLLRNQSHFRIGSLLDLLVIGKTQNKRGCLFRVLLQTTFFLFPRYILR